MNPRKREWTGLRSRGRGRPKPMTPEMEAVQTRASLQVLATAVAVALLSKDLAPGEARNGLVTALKLPRVQDALK